MMSAIATESLVLLPVVLKRADSFILSPKELKYN